MKCLIVTAHPLHDSLCQALAGDVERELSQRGHSVDVEDLYGDGFQPALTVQERSSYYLGAYDSSGVAQQVDRLRYAEVLVLVFPTWWFGFPAILKGWFDRVWGPGIAFDNSADMGPIQPRLQELKHVLVVTTLGSPWWVDRLLMRRPVKKVLKLALLGACARNSKLQFLSLYSSEKLTEQKVATFRKKILKALAVWA